jgi:hypothetical protein
LVLLHKKVDHGGVFCYTYIVNNVIGVTNMSISNQVINLQTYSLAKNYANPNHAYKLLSAIKPIPSKSKSMSKFVSTFMHNSQILNNLANPSTHKEG